MSIILFIGILSFFVSIFMIIWWQRRKKRYSPLVEPALRLPGYSLSMKMDDLWDRVLIVYIFLAILPFLYVYQVNTGHISNGMSVFFIFFLSGLIALAILVRLFLKIRNYQLGRDGEIYTGQELNLLMREGAWVFHDIRYQYGNIDHLVVSTGGVFVVETKTARKPSNASGKKEHIVIVRDEKFVRPNLGAEPIEQVERNANYIRKILLSELGFKPLVVSCIALPGWFVKPNPLYVKQKVIVFNPKRKASILKLVRRNKMPVEKVGEIAAFFDKRCRSMVSKADITDPNANEKYDFLFNRKADKLDI